MLENTFRTSTTSEEELEREEKAIVTFANRHLKGLEHISSRTSYAVRRYVFDIKDVAAAESYRSKRCRMMLNIAMGVKNGTSCETEFDEGKFIISVPRKDKETLWLGNGIQHLATIPKTGDDLLAYVGEKESGNPAIIDFMSTPHWMIAGYTGSGKTVCMNDIILSLLSRYTPEELNIYVADHKSELTHFDKIKHVKMQATTPEDIKLLFELILAVMEDRKRDFQGTNITYYNQISPVNKQPHIVVFFDEADSILREKSIFSKTLAADIRSHVNVLVSEARSLGIHLVLGSQKPAAMNIPTSIRSNVGGRIALKVANSMDSRVILDERGAEKLLGNGDAYLLQTSGGKERIQCAFASMEEIQAAREELAEAY